jgi:hypothetical protein
MKSVSANVAFNPRASRVELLVRIVWAILAGLVLWIFALIAGIVWIIQILHILIYARRHKGMQSFVKSVMIQSFRLSAYIMLLTDERPPIIPEMMPA